MKLSILSVVGFLACTVAGQAQTNQPVAEPPPAAATTNSALATTNGPVEPSAVMRVITMDDVPLTDAIKNLARQAGINYMLDPRVGFGQPSVGGQPMPQPTVTLRWENITAGQALLALLNNYNLQLVNDANTHISRVTPKDPAALPPLVTKIVQLQYTNATNLLASVNAAFNDKRSKVLPERPHQPIGFAGDGSGIETSQ